MIKINSNSNGFSVEGVDNVFYPDNGTLVFAANTVIMVLDESEMVTFRSAANNDVLFSGLIGQIQIGGETVTKQNIIDKFDEVANKETGGGDMDEYYTKSETDTLLSGKADTDDIPTDNAELANGAGYITNSALNGYATEQWVQSQGYAESSDLATVATSGSYEDLSDKPTIPTVPTNVSAFTNDAGYLTEHQSLENYYTKSETDALIPNVEDYFDGAEYDSNTRRINFKHGNTIKAYIDATAFIKDGMVENVEISNGNLVITFNTDAGKQPISIPLTDIFNPSNYYTKTDADGLFATKVVVNEEIAARIEGDNALNTALGTKADKSDTYTKAQVDTAIQTAVADYVLQSEFDAKEETISTALNDLEDTKADKSDVYTKSETDQAIADALDDIDLSDYYTKSQVDTALGTKANATDVYTKTQTDSAIETAIQDIDLSNYVDKQTFDIKEEVISTALNDLEANKQDKLTAGANITIENNVISASGSAAQIQSDWNQSDSTAVDFIKNKPSLTNYYTKSETDDTFVSKSVYNQKEIATSKALTQLNDNKADKSTTYTKTEVDGLIPTVPTNVSAFTNDAGYLTQHQSLSNYYTKTETDNTFVSQADFDVKEEVISDGLNTLNTSKADASSVYTKSEIDAMIGNINTILASI